MTSTAGKSACLVALSSLAILMASCTRTTLAVPSDPNPVLGSQIMSSVGGCSDVRDGVTAPRRE
jgi:hypothetical protein